MWLGVVSLCLVQFVDVLGVTVMVTALPAMLADLRASADAASLISTGYAMFFAGLLLLAPAVAGATTNDPLRSHQWGLDMIHADEAHAVTTGAGGSFGHRRIILTGLAIFTVSAVVGATATSAVMLTAARCLQGDAAALSVPSALRLLTTITSDGPQQSHTRMGCRAGHGDRRIAP